MSVWVISGKSPLPSASIFKTKELSLLVTWESAISWSALLPLNKVFECSKFPAVSLMFCIASKHSLGSGVGTVPQKVDISGDTCLSL